MDNSQPTLKDLAKRLNLSIGTVQRALHNKGGYRPETQQRVLEEAAKIGYTVNAAASALRRTPMSVAVVLPEPIEMDRFFYRNVWQGIEQANHELSVYQISFHRFYARNNSEEFYRIIEELSLSGEYQGIITQGSSDERYLSAMERFAEKGVLVGLINDAQKRSSVNFDALAADILHLTQPQAKGQVLLLGGSQKNQLHLKRSFDFSRQLSKLCPDLSVLEIHLYDNVPKLEQTLRATLPHLTNLTGIVAVTARETMCMCQAVSESGLAGKLTTIGMDAFPELLPYFSSRALTASIYHYPSRMTYSLAHQVAAQLTGIAAPVTTQIIPAVPVLQSSAAFFCGVEGII